MRQTAPGSDRRQTEVLALLVENARQFLQKALGELPDDPKSSVIDFYSGVELILKARLLHEHWTLIVARDPHRNRFHSGDFTSVTFDEACRRIDAVLSCPLPDAAFRAFDKIRKHRNRMVHFYDADLVSSSGRLRGVALAQLQAWYQLNKLMRADWQDVFAPMRDRFAGIERVLHRHRGYAAAKYQDLKAQIEALRRNGHAFGRCGRCAQPAAQAYPIERGLRQLRCQVCDESWPEMDIQCPSCACVLTAGRGEGLVCKACGWSADSALRFAIMAGAGERSERTPEVLTPAHCEACCGYETICSFGDGYLCVHCLTYTASLTCCGWCGGYHNGDGRGWAGCMQCDGAAGYREDE